MGPLLSGYKKWSRGCFALCLVSSVIILSAQSPGNFGVLVDSAACDALPLMPLFEQGQKGDDGLPASQSLRPYCPRPLDQGASAACAGFAAAYGAMTILEAIGANTTDPTEISQLACSPWFVYNQIKQGKGDCNTPASMEKAIQVLKEQGVCLYSEFHPAEGDCDAVPNQTIKQLASTRKLKDAAVLFEWKSSPEQKIVAVRNALAGGLPVVAMLTVFKSFRDIPSGIGSWKMRSTQTENYLDQHFLVVTGYDDRSQRFELMSSWGTAWADGGFVSLSYQDFAAICRMAYQFLPYDFSPPIAPILADASTRKHLSSTPTQTRTAAAGQQKLALKRPTSNLSTSLFLQGKFEFVRPVWSELRNAFEFAPEGVIYDSKAHCYTMAEGTFPVGTQFMLRSSAIPTGKYVYVFSCDPTGAVKLHWPKNDRQAQFVPGEQVVISIPSPNDVFVLAHPGDDFLCILYSDDPIPDLRERMARMRGYSASNFHAVLANAFSGLLIAPEKVQLEGEAMRAKCSIVRKDGTAMAIVLRVRGE
ncbi:MAG: hypothetical protein H7246_22680 [Phycisphaerae bacterium]|nr:hypothetical protein [Saprospiraceae bacterium]